MTESTAIATTHSEPPQAQKYEPRDSEAGYTLAQRIAGSGLVPKGLQGHPEDIFLILARGADLGLSWTQSLQMVIAIKGRTTLTADAHVAVALRSGHCEYFRAVEQTDTRAVWETKRRGSSPQRYTFTKADAVAAGLWGQDGPWRAHPARMLSARCKTFLARDVYPDLLAGMLTPDEVREIPASPAGRDEEPEDPRVVEVPSEAFDPREVEVVAEPEPPQAQAKPAAREPPAGYLAEVDAILAALDQAGVVNAREALREVVAKRQAEVRRWLTPDELRGFAADLLPGMAP